MNLLQLIERYIAHRQALGARFRAEACMLRVFGRSVGSHAKVGAVRPEQVSAFLAGHGPTTRYWFAKYDGLRGFNRYTASRGYVANCPCRSGYQNGHRPSSPTSTRTKSCAAC